MVLFKSPHPDLNIPTKITTWEWLFEGRSQCYSSGRYMNAVTKEKLDWPDIKEKSTRLCTSLQHRYGLDVGQTVSLFSTNTIWYPIAMWATIRAGGRVNGASPAYTVEEMTYALRTAESKFLMTLPGSLNVAIEAATNAGIPRDHIFLLEDEVEGFVSIQKMIEDATDYPTKPPFRIPDHKTNKEICGYLNFSSGTTGLPKAVMLSHHNIIAQCYQLKQIQVLGAYQILAVMPLFHITGLVRFCHYPLFMNGVSVMLPSFTMEAMLKAIVEFKIKELILVPPIIIRLVKDPIVNNFDLRHVERWSSGSAPISAEIIQLLQKKFPWTGFRQGFGATESTACISAHPPSHYDYRFATTGGLLVANTVAKVIDIDSGEELEVNKTGEILAKGPQIAMGYLGNPSATAESFDAEGYLHTGDVGRIDKDGLIHIEDRIKEMIKVKGLQVPPAELEDLLLGHRDVEDCAVLGIPDNYSGERPKAFVYLKPGVAVSQEKGKELLNFVKDKKVRYKWLAEIEFTDAIPKSPTGKLLRRVLKAKEKILTGHGLRVREEEKAKL